MAATKTVVIVGAGPTGLSAAILLRLRGYDPVVLDRRPSLVGLPAAHVVNTRSQEVLAEMGLAGIVEQQGDPSALSSLVVWVESMAGREYGVLPIQGAAVDERGPLSAFCSVNIPQTEFEPILLARLAELGGTVRFGEEVIGVQASGDRVRADVRSTAGDSSTFLECDWLIGCDGAASVVRRSVGIEMEGPRTIARFMTIYFRADLDRYRNGREGLLYWIGGKDARGVFICFDKPGRTWAMLVPIGELSLGTFGDDAARTIVRKAIGSEHAAIQLLGLSSWNMSAQVAVAFRKGRVLLAGDACHRFPPTGGLGMNTGIQDAHNLAWKLAAVIEGRAPEALLDTYEEERRPIARRNTDQSVRNLMKMQAIDKALGIDTLAPIAADAGEGSIASYPPERLGIDGDGPAEVARRAAIQRAVDEQAEHFAQGAGVDLGFSYAGGAFVPDNSPPPSNEPCHYRPDAHPGARLPYSSATGRFEDSTLGLVRPSGVTLFALDRRWADIAARVEASTGVPVQPVFFGDGSLDLGPMTRGFLGIDEGGAVAVRPDGHVAWRSWGWPRNPVAELEHAARVSHGLARRAAT